jgi:6-phosphogluconolactonase
MTSAPSLSPDLHIFDDIKALSRAAAEEFTELANRQKPAGSPFIAALSGGSSPKPFYELLATPEFSSKIPWPRVHLFQVDERAVPPDSPQGNYKMIRETLLEHVPLPASNFHRMAAENPDRDAVADAYAAELRSIAGVGQSEYPQLDLISLGVGEEGHTASLFPGTAALNEKKRAVSPNYVPQVQMWRMTLTLPALNSAARIIFLVSGAEKAPILRQVLKDSNPSTPLPAQLVQPWHGSVAWYVDREAAQQL